MKARMLCFTLLLVSGAALAQGRDHSSLDAEIKKAIQEEEALNQERLKIFAKEETVSFYKADWLSLRQRKKRAIANHADIKIRKIQEVSN